MDLFNLAATLTLDSSQFDRGIKQANQDGQGLAGTLEKSFSKIKGLAKAAAGIWTGSKIIGGMTSLVKQAYHAYASFEQLEGGVKTLFKESSNTVFEFAKEAYKNVGISSNQYMEIVTSFSASLIQSLKGDTERAARLSNMALEDMSDNANKMGTDFEAVQRAYQGFAKGNFTMLDNLKLGYGGTKTEMKRLLKDAEAIQRANGKMVKYSINSYADMIEAIHVVQTEMGITGTTAAEADQTVEGSMKMLKASWQDVILAMGKGEGISQAMYRFSTSFKNAMKNSLPAIKQALKGLGSMLSLILPEAAKQIPQLIADFLPDLWDAAKKVASGFWEGLKSAFAKIKWPSWDEVKDAAVSAWNTIKAEALNLAGLVFGKKADGSVNWPTWDEVKDAATTVWNDIVAGALGVGKDVAKLVFGTTADGEVAWPTWDDVKEAAKGVWEGIVAGATTVGQEFGKLIFGTTADGGVAWPDPNAVLADFQTWWSGGEGGEGGVSQKLTDAASWVLKEFGIEPKFADKLAGILGSWWDTAVNTVTSVASWALNLPSEPWDAGTQLHDIVAKWWEGVSGGLEDLLHWVLGIPDMPDENGVTVAKKIEQWWDDEVVPALQGALDFTLGLLGLPSVEQQAAAIAKWWEDIKSKIGAFVLSIVLRLGQTPEQALGLKDGMSWGDSVVQSYNEWGMPMVDLSTSTIDFDDEHAKGLRTVPYDNYAALLHRGERILTASQARHADDFGGTAEVVSAIMSLGSDMRAMRFQVGKKDFGRVVVDYAGNGVANYTALRNRKIIAGYGG